MLTSSTTYLDDLVCVDLPQVAPQADQLDHSTTKISSILERIKEEEKADHKRTKNVEGISFIEL